MQIIITNKIDLVVEAKNMFIYAAHQRKTTSLFLFHDWILQSCPSPEIYKLLIVNNSNIDSLLQNHQHLVIFEN